MKASMSLKVGRRAGFSLQHCAVMLLNLPLGSLVSGWVAPCPTCQIRECSGRVEKGYSRVTSSYTMVLEGKGAGEGRGGEGEERLLTMTVREHKHYYTSYYTNISKFGKRMHVLTQMKTHRLQRWVSGIKWFLLLAPTASSYSQGAGKLVLRLPSFSYSVLEGSQRCKLGDGGRRTLKRGIRVGYP